MSAERIMFIALGAVLGLIGFAVTLFLVAWAKGWREWRSMEQAARMAGPDDVF
jgi:hypothetical protein